MSLPYSTKQKTKRFGWRDDLAAALDIIWLGLAWWGVMIFGFQIIWWLQEDAWRAAPLLSLFAEQVGKQPSMVPTGVFHSDWLANPANWVGLHRIVYGILDFLPLSVSLYGAAFAIYGYRQSISDAPLIFQK